MAPAPRAIGNTSTVPPHMNIDRRGDAAARDLCAAFDPTDFARDDKAIL